MAWCTIILSRVATVSGRARYFVLGQDLPGKSCWFALGFVLQITTANAADYLTYEQTAPGSVDDVPTGQYTHQHSVGDELAGDFSTCHLGVKSDLSYAGAVLTLAYTRTGDNSDIRNPWGGSPSYASLILEDFDRAGENAWRLGLSYDFAGVGWKGMSGFVNYANGDTDDYGGNASPDREELDFTLDFKPPEGMFQGLWLRARAAFVDEKGPDARDLADYRLIQL